MDANYTFLTMFADVVLSLKKRENLSKSKQVQSQSGYGNCLLVLLCTFMDLDRITVCFDKLYNTDFCIETQLLGVTCQLFQGLQGQIRSILEKKVPVFEHLLV